MTAKKSALGRGLDALIGDNDINNTAADPITSIDIDSIEANPYQPRTSFDEESLAELADSIKEVGLIQPVTVRKIKDNKYQLITGERRLRAAKMAGRDTIPALVRTSDDQGLLEISLVENIQREDLDAIEIAASYQRLIEECSLTQENISERVGKKRATISNYLRLLKLPDKIQSGIKNKKISMGHARALISIKDEDTQMMIYDQVIKYDFSVRKTEEIVRELDENNKTIKKSVKKFRLPEEYKQLKDHLCKFFNTEVDFRRTEEGEGKIIISFKSDDDLERIVGILDKLET